MIQERTYPAASGILILIVLLLAIVGSVAAAIASGRAHSVAGLIAALVSLVVEVFLLAGLFIVHPNQGKVLQLFGKYVGTVKEPGLKWANPFFAKTPISQRVRNFETDKLTVNDQRGNPVVIGAVVVWKVVDTAEAVFEVDDYENYVHIQSESALRNLATGYPYDAHEEGETSLSGHTKQISDRLKVEIQDRLDKAGVNVIEARISHLAYSQEIAAAMLQRQQASAVVAARQKIVEGAVGMVETALEMLSKKQVIELDEERKAAMVSNLLVVLCSDRHTQPVVNTGTLHH